MAKKKKKVKKSVKAENQKTKTKEAEGESTILTEEFIEDKIKEQVAKCGDKLTDEEKEMQYKALREVFVEGKDLAEAMDLPEDFLKLLYKQAYDQYNLGLYREANHCFRVLCIFEPHNPRYQLGIAATNHQMGNYELASTLYFVAWYCDLTSPIPLVYASDCFTKLGQPEASYLVLKIAYEICQDKKEYSRLKARCHLMMKRLREEYGIHKEDEEEGKEEKGEDIFSQLQQETEKDVEGAA